MKYETYVFWSRKKEDLFDFTISCFFKHFNMGFLLFLAPAGGSYPYPYPFYKKHTKQKTKRTKKYGCKNCTKYCLAKFDYCTLCKSLKFAIKSS